MNTCDRDGCNKVVPLESNVLDNIKVFISLVALVTTVFDLFLCILSFKYNRDGNKVLISMNTRRLSLGFII